MDARKLISVMDIVEQDHDLVLNRIHSLKEATHCLLEVGRVKPQPLLRRLRELNDFFVTRLAAHFEEEEQSLFPYLEQTLPDGPALVARLRSDHKAINRKREEFANCLELASELEDGITRAVVEDLFTYGWDLWDLLDQHAHAETESLRQCIAHLAKISESSRKVVTK